eukprot:scaffold654_cov207-Ochromonas_danica.AAC.6
MSLVIELSIPKSKFKIAQNNFSMQDDGSGLIAPPSKTSVKIMASTERMLPHISRQRTQVCLTSSIFGVAWTWLWRKM